MTPYTQTFPTASVLCAALGDDGNTLAIVAVANTQTPKVGISL